MLKGKTVVVGVCGGIAAYKIVEVVSRLRKLNAEVNVVMTNNAAKFVAPLTFQSVSHNFVVVDMFDEPKYYDIKHISLAEKADLFLIAPATANIIGKVANGIADDMLTTTLMATGAPVIFAPAMNTAMYENKIVQNNILKLQNMGYEFLEPGTGMMACGTSGKGRLPEPESIVKGIIEKLCPKADMASTRVLITAGPTQEQIDPVRYITNKSSGKMGYAIAAAASNRGASVRLISGPVQLEKPCNVEAIDVITAEEMYNEVMKSYEDFDILIMVAAVSDYKCAHVSDNKIKKSNEKLVLELTKNHDIAEELGKVKGKRILVGFSAETENLLNYAKAKIESKNLDIIVANDVTQEGAGFGTDTNIVKIIHRNGSIKELPKMDKSKVANEILDEVMQLIIDN